MAVKTPLNAMIWPLMAGANIYITGWTGDTTGIATAGSYQDTLIASEDIFVAKFTGQGGGITSGLSVSPDVSICIGSSANLNSQRWQWCI